MPPPHKTEIQIITTSQDLAALCTRLAQHSFIAVDTEFMREKTYYAQLCLIQIGSESEAAIIDPLAKDMDLGPILALMQDQSVLKIFHSGRQDIEIFVQLMGKLPEPCYDTQIAAMVCGYGDQVGYDKLVHAMLGITIDKGSRFTDWSKRPLAPEQLAYALNDVVYLNKVFPILRQEIEDAGRSRWIDEEMSVLSDISIYKIDPDEAWRKIRLRGARPAILNRLKCLAAWREREAQRRDIPKPHLIKDDTLMAIAQANPNDAGKLGKIRGFPGGKAGKLVPIILKILQKAHAVEESDWPEIPEPLKHKPAPAVVEMLRVLIKHVADDAAIAQRLIANADELNMIALGQTEGIKAMTGWRYDLFGKHAEAMIQGRLAFSIRKGQLKLTSIDG